MAIQVYQDIYKNFKLGIWKIEEELATLETMANLSHDDLAIYGRCRTTRRKLEWLATRVLLSYMGMDAPISFYDNGKPFFNDSNCSISHTQNWVAVVLNTNIHCGVDIEKISGKAARVQSKFVHSAEAYPFSGNCGLSENQYYTLLWSIKEAVYKKYSHTESLEFKNQIRLCDTQSTKSGTIQCICQGNFIHELVSLKFDITPDYVLAYTTD